MGKSVMFGNFTTKKHINLVITGVGFTVLGAFK